MVSSLCAYLSFVVFIQRELSLYDIPVRLSVVSLSVCMSVCRL